MDKLFKIPYWAFLALLVYMPFHIFISQWLSTFTGGLEVWKVWKDVLLFLAVLASVLLVYIKHGLPQAPRLRLRFSLSLRNVLSRIKKYGEGVSQKKPGHESKSTRGVASSASEQSSTARSLRFFWIISGLSILYIAFHFLIWAVNPEIEGGPALLATVYNGRLFGYMIVGFAAALLVKSRVSSPASQVLTKTIFKIALTISTIACLIALLQWLLPKDILTHFGYSVERGVKPNFFIDDKPDLPRVFSTLRDPNSLGAFLILPITLLSAAWFKLKNARILISGLLLLHGLILLLTFSRSALLGTFVSVAFVLLWQYRAKAKKFITRFWPVLLAVSISLIVIVVLTRDNYVVQNLVFHADESTQLDDPNEKRLKFYQSTTQTLIENPLGHGPGTAGLVSTRTDKVVLTENYFLQIAYEVGIAGLALLLFIMYLVIKRLYKRQDFYGRVMVCAFIGVTLSSMFLHTWANEAVAAQWWLLVGVLAAQRPRPKAST